MTIGRGKLAADKSRAPGRIVWTKCLPCDTVHLMKLLQEIQMQSTVYTENDIYSCIWKLSSESEVTVKKTF